MMKPLLFDVKSLLQGSIYKKYIKSFHLTDQFHFHNTYEIDFISRGSGRRIVGDNIDTYSDGDLIILPPYMPHANYSESTAPGRQESVEKTTLATVIYFLPDWISDKHVESPGFTSIRSLLANIGQGIKIYGETKNRILPQLDRLRNDSGIEGMIIMLTIFEILSKSQEYNLLSSRGYVNAYDSKDVDRIDRIYKYVMHNFKDKISLDDIAAVSHMTATAFCKYFKSKTNKTFSNFVNEIRVSHACKLLINSRMDISEVYYRSGFNNIASFNKNFRRFTKKTPTEYRLSLMPAISET